MSASDMPGEMVNREILGYLEVSTLGSIDIMIANLAMDANIVHDSRIFGHRPDIAIRIAASSETSTDANGISEKNVSMLT